MPGQVFCGLYVPIILEPTLITSDPKKITLDLNRTVENEGPQGYLYRAFSWICGIVYFKVIPGQVFYAPHVLAIL